jgi:hypothetical protein
LHVLQVVLHHIDGLAETQLGSHTLLHFVPHKQCAAADSAPAPGLSFVH